MRSGIWATVIGVALLLGGAAARPREDGDGPYPVSSTRATRADAGARAALERPGHVFFSDGFESTSSLDNYFEIRGRDDGRARLVQGPWPVHTGRGAIQFTAPANGGNSSGAGASLWFGPNGYDRVHYRRYLRFASDYDQGDLNHTGGGLAGVVGTNKWGGMGQAGIRPEGDDRFTSSFEPWREWQRDPAPGYMFLYTYWVDMEQGSDGNYWGNHLEPPEGERLVPERGRWYCLEHMIRVNDVGRANGELAAWIDGELYIHYTGFRWRTSADVRLKRADLGIYIHHAEKENVVWYDDVALSTGYIGLLAAGPAAVARPSWGRLKSRLPG